MFSLQSPCRAAGSHTRRTVTPKNAQENSAQFHIINRLTLIGFLGQDAEQRFTPQGAPYTSLSLATKTSWKDQNGEWQSRTEWHRAVVWGEKFSNFAATLKKGAHVQVEGPLRSREYQKDGVTHRSFECKAESILKLDRAARDESPEPAGTDPSTEDVPF